MEQAPVEADPAGLVKVTVSMSLTNMLKAGVAAGLWCSTAYTLRICHWLAMDDGDEHLQAEHDGDE